MTTATKAKPTAIDTAKPAAVEAAVTAPVDAAPKDAASVVKGYEDVVQFGRDNVEAVVKSGTIVAKGLQDLSKDLFTLAQTSVEEGVAASKALATVKSLQELIDIQQSLAKSNFDKFVSEASRIGELQVKLAEEALAPITARWQVTLGRFGTAA